MHTESESISAVFKEYSQFPTPVSATVCPEVQATPGTRYINLFAGRVCVLRELGCYSISRARNEVISDIRVTVYFLLQSGARMRRTEE